MAERREALIARRRAMGYTQESLAAALGVERSTVVRWELGAASPQSWRRHDLAAALSVTLEELDDLLIIRATGPTRRVKVDKDLPHELRSRTARLRRLDDYLGGADTHALYVAELTRTSRLAGTALCSERTRRALLSVVAEQAQLAGWAAFDAGQQTTATRLYRTSRLAAQQAEDRELEANALAFLAYQAVSRFGRAVDVAVASCEAAGYDASPTVRALLWERRAWAHAVAGQARDTERCLGVAEEALGREEGTPPDWAWWVDRNELRIMAGRCWAELGRPLRAISLLESVLSDFDDAKARDKALYLTWLAGAHLDAGEVEQAVMITRTALGLATGVGSVRPRLRIDLMLRRLKPHRAMPQVADLVERAAGWGQP